jgi:hypothetical protein
MKKLFVLFIALFALMCAAPSFATYDHYVIYVYKDNGFATAAGGYTARTSGITYKVLDADTNTASTIYSDGGTTSKTNPVTTTVFEVLDRIDFYIDATTTSVDIIVTDTVGGFSHVLKGATANTRTCIIDERYNVMHHGIFWYTSDTTGSVALASGVPGTFTSNGTMDTGVDFLANTMFLDCNIEIVTATTISTTLLCVGVGATSTRATQGGLVRYMVIDAGGTYVYATNSNTTAESQTLGSLVSQTGFTTTTLGSSYFRKNYVAATAASLSYTIVSSDLPGTSGASGKGYIHYFFTVLR